MPGIERVCHRCHYSLRGHAAPARCPECGTAELSLEEIAKVRRLVVPWYGARAFLACFREPFRAVFWEAALHPTFTRVIHCRALALLACIVLMPPLLHTCAHVYSLSPFPPRPPGAVETRYAWIESEFNDAQGVLQWKPFDRDLVLFTVDEHRGGMSVRLNSATWRPLRPGSRFANLLVGNYAGGQNDSIVAVLLLAYLVWPLLSGGLSGLRGSLRGTLLVSGVSVLSLLVFESLLYLCRFAFVLGLVDEATGVPVARAMLALAFLTPGLVFTRMAIGQAGSSSRWRRIWQVAVACACTLIVPGFLVYRMMWYYF